MAEQHAKRATKPRTHGIGAFRVGAFRWVRAWCGYAPGREQAPSDADQSASLKESIERHKRHQERDAEADQPLRAVETFVHIFA